MLDNWADSVYVGESIDETAQRNAAALGQVDLLRRLLNAHYEEITETLYDSKQ